MVVCWAHPTLLGGTHPFALATEKPILNNWSRNEKQKIRNLIESIISSLLDSMVVTSSAHILHLSQNWKKKKGGKKKKEGREEEKGKGGGGNLGFWGRKWGERKNNKIKKNEKNKIIIK